MTIGPINDFEESTDRDSEERGQLNIGVSPGSGQLEVFSLAIGYLV